MSKPVPEMFAAQLKQLDVVVSTTVKHIQTWRSQKNPEFDRYDELATVVGTLPVHYSQDALLIMLGLAVQRLADMESS